MEGTKDFQVKSVQKKVIFYNLQHYSDVFQVLLKCVEKFYFHHTLSIQH